MRISNDDHGENEFETQDAHLILTEIQNFLRNLIERIKTKETIITVAQKKVTKLHETFK